MKHKIYFQLIAAAFSLLTTTIHAQNNFFSSETVEESTASAAVKPAQIAGTTGLLSVVWGDGHSESKDVIKYFLTDDESGKTVELDINEGLENINNPLLLGGKRVEIFGSENNSFGQSKKLVVEKLRVLSDAPPESRPASVAGVAGTTKWVNILCRFSDSANVTPRATEYFQNLFGNAAPGLNHYWRETSYNKVNLDGSLTVGWYNLPNPRSYYVYDTNGDGILDVDFTRLVNDSVAVADPDVYFPAFFGVNFVFNQELDGLAYGGKKFINADGGSNLYGVTYLPPWAYENQGSIIHEMGHGFGASHSGSTRACPPRNNCYDSQWDPMSSSFRAGSLDPTFGSVVNHTISYYKDLLGWIPENRKITVLFGQTQTIQLDGLANDSGSGYLMAKIPIRGVSNAPLFTIETRIFSGYDRFSPGEAVIIHRINPDDFDTPARVVSSAPDGDPNGAGAQWTVGEEFVDAATGISIYIAARTSNGFQVRVVNPARNPVADFDGDKKSDVALYRQTTGVWYQLKSRDNSVSAFRFGLAEDRVVAGDYDGDGISDAAVYRPGEGVWYIWQSRTNNLRVERFGTSEDIPVPADFDRDGKLDIAVFRPGSSVWFIKNSSSQSIKYLQFGKSTDVPVPADFDGDGKADVAVFRPGSGEWFYAKSNTNISYPLQMVTFRFGLSGDVPVAGDYDGDGRTDYAVFRPAQGNWYVWQSSSNSLNVFHWGMAGDRPVPGDYDGDGKSDAAVYRGGVWYLLKTTEGYAAFQFGLPTDLTMFAVTGF